MKVLARRTGGLFLSDAMQTYEPKQADPSYVIYHQFLTQLHLPCEKWEYNKENTSAIYLQIPDEMEEMDSFTLKFMDVKQFVYPARLFTYFLLQNYVGKPNHFSGIGMFHKRKSHLLFLSDNIDFKSFGTGDFWMDDFGRFTLKSLKKSDLQNAFESFFVLIDSKFEAKLQLALTQYASSTGNSIDKSLWLNRALNMDRLAALQQYIRPYIY